MAYSAHCLFMLILRVSCTFVRNGRANRNKANRIRLPISVVWRLMMSHTQCTQEIVSFAFVCEHFLSKYAALSHSKDCTSSCDGCRVTRRVRFEVQARRHLAHLGPLSKTLVFDAGSVKTIESLEYLGSNPLNPVFSNLKR